MYSRFSSNAHLTFGEKNPTQLKHKIMLNGIMQNDQYSNNIKTNAVWERWFYEHLKHWEN